MVSLVTQSIFIVSQHSTKICRWKFGSSIWKTYSWKFGE